ncbi:hypothetical protein LXL04_004203 [Taraxacum kok-saghyz]
MKKAFDQTFRDIKRGVNKKVLKVPSIEQKVLDATSNEPWGPHGTHLSDIAQASKNYHEYQMIMTIVWKRLNDTGKNWRHVYKGLTILEYLVANGSERVIEDIREHAYQITSLSAFQYIDSTGRDQGSNVRKKSQLLVALVNDKDKIQEARDKAASSRDKLREGRNGGREEDRNGYGREREWGGEDEYRGRSTSNDGSDNGPRSRSSDRYWEDDGHHSSRGSNARVEDASPDARTDSRLEPKSSGAPPGYEDAMNATVPADTNINRDGENTSTFTSKPPSPQVAANHQETPAAAPPPAASQPPPANNENDGFDFFDPRAAPAPAPLAPGGAEMDLFGSLSESFSSDALSLVPSTSVTTTEAPPANTNPYLTFDTASPGVTSQQPFDDPFGDGPFKAIPSNDGFSATSPFATSAADQTSGPGDNLGFGDAFDPTVDILADILPPPGPSSQTTATAFQTQPPASQNGQPPSFPAETAFSTPFGQPPQPMTHHDFPPQSTTAPQSAFQFPGGQQSMPQPHSDLQAQGSQQSAFQQLPGGQQQSMPQPQSALQDQGQQSMPLSSPFQVPNGQQQPMPQSSTLEQLLGGHQSIAQPSFQVQGGYHQSAFQQLPSVQQSMPQSAYQVPGGQQSALQVPGPQQSMPLQVQGGHQSIPQPSFPPQSVLQPALQSSMQPGFAPHANSQNGSFGLSSAGFPTSNGNGNGQSMLQPGFAAQGSQSMLQQNGNPTQPAFLPQPAQNGFPSNAQPNVSQPHPGFINSNGQQNNLYGGASSAPVPPLSQPTPAPAPHYNPSNFYQQQPSLTASTGALALVPQQPTDKKFETKSTVWADTLNRGLVNLNISGSKTNPLSDIGIDFDAINRKEKRMEKPTQKPVTSNITMGKAMGSGSGMGRAGAGVLRPAPNPMMAAPAAGYGINMGQGFQPQPHPHPMGMNTMPQNMGIGMNMMGGQGFPPGNYNPMMGRGQQQPYGGYR